MSQFTELNLKLETVIKYIRENTPEKAFVLPSNIRSEIQKIVHAAQEADKQLSSLFRTPQEIVRFQKLVEHLEQNKDGIISLCSQIFHLHQSNIIDETQKAEHLNKLFKWLLDPNPKNDFLNTQKESLKEAYRIYENNKKLWENGEKRQRLLETWKSIKNSASQTDQDKFEKLINQFSNNPTQDNLALQKAEEIVKNIIVLNDCKAQLKKVGAQYKNLVGEAAELAMKITSQEEAASLLISDQSKKIMAENSIDLTEINFKIETLEAAKKQFECPDTSNLEASEAILAVRETLRNAKKMLSQCQRIVEPVKQALENRTALISAQATNEEIQAAAAQNQNSEQPAAAATKAATKVDINAIYETLIQLVEARINKYQDTCVLTGKRSKKLDAAKELLAAIKEAAESGLTASLVDVQKCFSTLKHTAENMKWMTFFKDGATQNEKDFFSKFATALDQLAMQIITPSPSPSH